MQLPKKKTKGRLNRFHENDIPAINVTTFNDAVLNEERVHGGCKHLEYQQEVVVELHVPVTDNFEDDLDDLETEFWIQCSKFDIPGIDLTYDRGDLTPIKDTDTPQAIKLLTFTARYSVDSRSPNDIIT